MYSLLDNYSLFSSFADFITMVTDYCAKLKELLKTDLYVIKATKPPNYLSCFGITDKNIILIHKWVCTV